LTDLFEANQAKGYDDPSQGGLMDRLKKLEEAAQSAGTFSNLGWLKFPFSPSFLSPCFV
jgi:hypothetical protein